MAVIDKFLYSFAKSRCCRICVLTLGFTYIVFKTIKIQKYLRYSFSKWQQKRRLPSVVSTVSDANFSVQIIRRKLKEKQILGLDCEWVTTRGRRHPVALLQLATPDGFCSLFRLNLLKGVPKELEDVLGDKNIVKVGVAVVADARYLLADYGVHCEGCLDLRHLAFEVGVEPRGLANLANDLFGVELDKDWRVRCSDWEAEVLSSIQIQYAAQDACIAVDIFDSLNHKKICSEYSIWKRLFWSKKDHWHHSAKLWSPYIGLNFKQRSRGNGGSGHSGTVRRTKPVDAVIRRDCNTLLQRRHYSNNFLLAPDNQILCTISDSKAAWYIEKDLVETVNDDPKTLKLKFEPSRRNIEADGYYTRPKENKCVVCGSENDLRRKNVVPSEYRRHFEVVYKNHHSHDVLLMCLVCHTRSNMYDQQLRDTLVHECDAPLADGKNSKLKEMPDLRALRSAARALYNSGDIIPASRKTQLENLICEKLGISSDQLTWEFLENVINIECFVESEQYCPHGLRVVDSYKNRGGVEALERRWRQHFMDTMSPLFLPDLWSVNYVRD